MRWRITLIAGGTLFLLLPLLLHPSPLGEDGPLALSNVEGSGPGEGLRLITVFPVAALNRD